MLQFKRPLFWLYGFFALWALFAILAHFIFNPSPWILMLTFLLLLGGPGFCLARIFKINFQDDSLGQIVLWLAVGLLFSLSISFLAIILGLTLPFLVKVYLIVVGLFFCIAFFIDLKTLQFKKETYQLNLREIFRIKNIIFLLLGAFIILILVSVNQVGANFKGDPLFHLSILRKVIENQPLTVEGLSYIKSSPRLPYVFPVWHVFLGILSRITNLNIFSLWAEIPLSLSVLVLTVWFWFFKKILPNREIAYLALFLFIIYFWQVITAFNQYGYMFARLPVPDTLGQLILLPLSIALAIRYVSEKLSNYKDLIVIALLVLMMAMVHFTQYFYFLGIMIFFAIGYSVLKFREPQFKETIQKIILIVFASGLVILPFLVSLELKNKVISKAIALYANLQDVDLIMNFAKYDLYLKFSMIFLPLVLLFTKKYKQMSLIFLLFLIIPIVYIRPIEVFLGKILSGVFIRRFYNNTAWPFLIWALVLGFLLILFDRLVSKLNSISKYIRYGIDGALGIVAVVLVWLEFQFGSLTEFYQDEVFSKQTLSWLDENYIWLITVFSIIVILILVSQKYFKKIGDFFKISETQNKISNFLLIFIIIFFLISPAVGPLIKKFNHEVDQSHFFAKPYDPESTLASSKKIGGMATADFIKKNIPPKSVFDSDSGYFILPLLVDQHMSDYSSLAAKTYGKIYLENTNLRERLACINKGRIDYILLVEPETKKIAVFDNYPQYFKKIYQYKAIIYQVQKESIAFAGGGQNIVCRDL